jgi:hypothetical protein
MRHHAPWIRGGGRQPRVESCMSTPAAVRVPRVKRRSARTGCGPGRTTTDDVLHTPRGPARGCIEVRPRGRFDYLLVESTGISEPLPGTRSGRTECPAAFGRSSFHEAASSGATDRSIPVIPNVRVSATSRLNGTGVCCARSTRGAISSSGRTASNTPHYPPRSVSRGAEGDRHGRQVPGDGVNSSTTRSR